MTFMWKVNSRIHIFSVLSPGLLEMVRDRQREMCGSKNRTFLSPVVWEKVCERESAREAENIRFFESYVLCAVSYYIAVWDRQKEMCGS